MFLDKVYDSAHQKRRNDGANTQAIQMAEKQQRKTCGSQNQCDIKNDFDTAEFFAADLRNGFDNTLAGNHQHVRGNFDADTQCQYGTSYQQGKNLACKMGGSEAFQQCHADVDEAAENHIYHDLQILIRTELSAKQNYFAQNEKHIQQEGECTKGKGKTKT